MVAQIEVGQVWWHKDRRRAGKSVTVVEVLPGRKAVVQGSTRKSLLRTDTLTRHYTLEAQEGPVEAVSAMPGRPSIVVGSRWRRKVGSGSSVGVEVVWVQPKKGAPPYVQFTKSDGSTSILRAEGFLSLYVPFKSQKKVVGDEVE